MSVTSEPASAGTVPLATAAAPQKRGWSFSAWPLWGVVAACLSFAGTVIFDARPPAETEAWLEGRDYSVTADDVLTVDVLTNRLGWTAGLLAAMALLVFQALWRRHVERRFDSTGARIVSGAVIATAGAALLGYGWKGALANYLGPEAGLYDQSGLFVYYMLTDFGAYLPWWAMLAAALGVVWMAFGERIVSRILGAVSALAVLGVAALTLTTGVPGLPAIFMPMWLGLCGLWLALGRSRITSRELAR